MDEVGEDHVPLEEHMALGMRCEDLGHSICEDSKLSLRERGTSMTCKLRIEMILIVRDVTGVDPSAYSDLMGSYPIHLDCDEPGCGFVSLHFGAYMYV